MTEVLDRAGVAFDAVDGEAAFYGPKIDVQIVDSAGRESTLSTVRVDFYQPERFDLRYVGPDGGRHRPVLVHRSVIGSLDRVMAQLIPARTRAPQTAPSWSVRGRPREVRSRCVYATGAGLAVPVTEALARISGAVESRGISLWG